MKKYLIFILLFLVVFTCFSQKNESKFAKILPTSIYTVISNTTNFNSGYFINNKLNLTNFEFFKTNTLYMPSGYFNMPIYSFKNTSYNYFSQSINEDYRNLDLQKSFFNINDLYRPRSKNSW